MEINTSTSSTAASATTTITLPPLPTTTITTIIMKIIITTRNNQTRINNEGENYPNPERLQNETLTSNYRSITCLPMLWKIRTALISGTIDYFLYASDCFQKNGKDTESKQGEQMINRS